MTHFENFFRSLSNPCLILSARPPFSVLAANEAYLDVVQMDRMQLMGRPFSEAVRQSPTALAGVTAEELRTSFASVVATGQPHTLTVREPDQEPPSPARSWRLWHRALTSEAGEVEQIIQQLDFIPAEIQPENEPRPAAPTAKGRAYHEQAGWPKQLDGIAFDMTRRKTIEAVLWNSEARYRLLVESLHDYAVFMQDDEGQVTSWNPGAQRLLGYSEQEIIGQSARIFFTPEDQARGDDVREIRTAKETGRAHDDRWHVRKDGSRFFVSGMMVALKDDQDRRIGLAKIMRDITDRQIAQAEREQLLERERTARAEVERISRLKDDFLATLSHELRTPLNAILGWTQVLKESSGDAEELAQGLEVIDRNTRLQAELIEDLLDMSRVVSGKVRLRLQTVDVISVVQAAIDSLQTMAATKQIRLRFTPDAASEPLTGDRQRLQQIVLNLLSNAVKFTPRHGSVEVTVKADPTHVNLTVRDSGIGIRPEFLPYVFERFRQADGSTTRQHGGLGLGLSIVKQLVDLHGGDVQVTSDGEGQGAQFRVTLPRVGASGAPAAELAPPRFADVPRQKIDLRGVKVLVVDDEPDSARLVQKVLEDCHASVQSAGSMEEALVMFGDFHPDILLSDIGMPHHDGYELIRRVRALPGGNVVPAAALTALARREDVDRALHAGFQTHLAKPVEPSKLVSLTARLANR